MKKILVVCLGFSLILPSVFAFADEHKENKSKQKEHKEYKENKEDSDYDDEGVIPGTPSISHVREEGERSEKVKMTSLSKIQSQGKRLIRERINALEGNQKAVDKADGLTVDQKRVLTTILTSNITGLTTLNNAIASSTNATSTKILVESIFTQYRIYGIVIPKVRLEKRIFDLQNYVSKINATFTKVEAKIAEWKGKGKDVTSWQSNLNDAKALVISDSVKLSALLVQAESLTPASYGTSSKATIEAINQGLKIISKDFNTIGSKLRTPKEFKNATTPVVTSSSTAGTSTTPVVTSSSTAGTSTTR